MISARENDVRMGCNLLRGRGASLACFVVALALSGCGHKQLKFHIPAPSPVDLEAISSIDGQIDSVPEPEIGPIELSEPARPPVRRRPAPREDAGATPAPAETPAASAELSIGALSSGGDMTPQSQQQARDLIASVDRRVIRLPGNAASVRPQVRKVRNFLDEAKKALNSGDSDGAINLANRAKVLMDELERQ